MKGFSGFKPSPAKISDSELVDTVKDLGTVQNKFIEKGFVTATKGVTDKIDKKIMGKKKKGETTDEDKDDAAYFEGDQAARKKQKYSQKDAEQMENNLNTLTNQSSKLDNDILKNSGL